MRGKGLLLAVLLLGLMLGAAAGMSVAQGETSEGSTAVLAPAGTGPSASLGTGFTYQGRLNKGGSPYSGTCDLRFSLYDAASDGSQVGGIQTIPGVGVTDGFFTVVLNSGDEFGDSPFRGEARWLGIEVQCSGDADFTPLTPRQELTPAPYALALPGLWTQQNPYSSNLIGGYGGNEIAPGVYGATIGGGGKDGIPNRIMNDFGTVGGGYGNESRSDATVGGGAGNEALGYAATVGGGYENTASGHEATVNGGTENTASGDFATIGGGAHISVTGEAATVGGGSHITVTGDYATVGGGSGNSGTFYGATVGGGLDNTADFLATVGGGSRNSAIYTHATVAGGTGNTASRGAATVGGGQDNTADGYCTTVGGGTGNSANLDYVTIGGGQWNSASDYYATIGGGGSNTASGSRSTVCGGRVNTASNHFATVPGGQGALASHFGEMAYSSGWFASPGSGDAQTSVYVLRNLTTDSSWQELFLDGTGERLTVAANRTVTFDIWVVGRSSGALSAGYHLWGVLENASGLTSFVGGSWSSTLGEDNSAWNARVQSDNEHDALVVEVLGSGETIRWVAYVRTVEVAW